MIELRAHAEGTILPIRAHAGARRNDVRGVQDGRLKVSVTQAPEKGKANKAILELLAKLLDVKKSELTVLAGETSPQKEVLVAGVERAELAQRIKALRLDGVRESAGQNRHEGALGSGRH